jgi:hypothetical protein
MNSRHIQIGFLSVEGLSVLADHFEIPPASVWECAAETIALIISDFPGIFAEFEKKHFKLLWRESRDGFHASQFHSRCAGHANALTMILYTEGNGFGGFLPVKWESRKWNGKKGDENNCWKADNSEKSFLTTLKNPETFAEFRRNNSNFCGGGAAMVSMLPNFTADATATQTH